MFGYTGLYLRQQVKTGWLGLIDYAIAVVGAIFIFGDGIIGLAVFPVLATHAPELTAATGPMVTGRFLGLYILFFATNMVGIILLGVATLRAGTLPRLAGIRALGRSRLEFRGIIMRAINTTKSTQNQKWALGSASY